MTQRTPYPNLDEKLDTLEHINQDHPEELLLTVQELGDYSDATSAKIIEIYNEGMLVEVMRPNQDEPAQTFLEFEIKDELQYQILYLIYLASSRRGVTIGTNRKQFFTVLGTKKVTANMLRVEIESPAPLPIDEPGYAYWFALKTIEKLPKKAVKESKSSALSHLFMRGLLWGMKLLSPQRREKIMVSMSKGARYYTLRSVTRSTKEGGPDIGSFDVFLHGNSEGSLWAKSLKKGDVIFSQSESPNKIDHLKNDANTLLIADETGFPALASMLDQWKLNRPPHLLLLTQSAEEQSYFKEDDLPPETKITRITAPATEHADRVVEALRQIENVDAAWGALGKDAAKKVRHFLRHERQLTGKTNRIKAYW